MEIYRVSPTVKLMTRQILSVYAMAAPFKVLNMILGGGILRSGGRTAYVMGIDMLGTWAFGVPLGLLGAFVWRLPIAYVYLLLSLEECVPLRNLHGGLPPQTLDETAGRVIHAGFIAAENGRS